MANVQKELIDSYDGKGLAAEYAKYADKASKDVSGNDIGNTYATKAEQATALATKQDTISTEYPTDPVVIGDTTICSRFLNNTLSFIKVLDIWGYVQSAIESVLGLTASSYRGNAATANSTSPGSILDNRLNTIEDDVTNKQDKFGLDYEPNHSYEDTTNVCTGYDKSLDSFVFYRALKFWEYIQGKISSDLGITKSTASDAGKVLSVDANGDAGWTVPLDKVEVVYDTRSGTPTTYAQITAILSNGKIPVLKSRCDTTPITYEVVCNYCGTFSGEYRFISLIRRPNHSTQYVEEHSIGSDDTWQYYNYQIPTSKDIPPVKKAADVSGMGNDDTYAYSGEAVSMAISSAVSGTVGGFLGEKTVAQMNTYTSPKMGDNAIVTNTGTITVGSESCVISSAPTEVRWTTSASWKISSAGYVRDTQMATASTAGVVKTNSASGGVSLNSSNQMVVNGWSSKQDSLGSGTAGQYLKSNGPGNAPSWDNADNFEAGRAAKSVNWGAQADPTQDIYMTAQIEPSAYAAGVVVPFELNNKKYFGALKGSYAINYLASILSDTFMKVYDTIYRLGRGGSDVAITDNNWHLLGLGPEVANLAMVNMDIIINTTSTSSAILTFIVAGTTSGSPQEASQTVFTNPKTTTPVMLCFNNQLVAHNPVLLFRVDSGSWQGGMTWRWMANNKCHYYLQ